MMMLGTDDRLFLANEAPLSHVERCGGAHSMFFTCGSGGFIKENHLRTNCASSGTTESLDDGTIWAFHLSQSY